MRTTARLSLPWEASSPAVKSSESPGRKNPTSRPDSAKMIAIRPIVPKVRMMCSGFRLSSASTCTTLDPTGPSPG